MAVCQFFNAFRPLLSTDRNFGRDWHFSLEQIGSLTRYFGATRLLLDCLDLATYSDRQTIEDTLLLPPGEWYLAEPEAW